MEDKEKILRCIYRAMDEIGDVNPRYAAIEKKPDTHLFGKQSCLDSLGLVSLIVAVEETLRDEIGLSVTLADDRAMSRLRSPFRTVGSLADYVAELAGS